MLSAAEIRELQTIFERMGAAYDMARDRRVAARPLQPESRIALWTCLSATCRIGELHVSPATIRNQVHSVYQKLGLSGRFELAKALRTF